MPREADNYEIECCPFCKEEDDIDRSLEGLTICNNCGRNYKIIEDNL